jgi:type IV pilus assembly protein PilE
MTYSMRLHQGFTLLELIISVMIVGILTAIALPNYTNYVQRADVSQAQQRMQGLAIELENWRSKSLTYKGFEPDSGFFQNDKEILVPTGSSLTNYRYKITLVDLAGAQPSLRSASALGRSWVMIAQPNSSIGALKTADQLYYQSTGQRCAVPFSVTLSVNVNPCNSSSSKPWN